MMNLIKLSTFLLTVGTVAAKGGPPADKGKPTPASAPVEETFPEFLDNGDVAPQCANYHFCDCFTCGAVTEKDDGTMDVQINHCKDGSISWMCCSALDGEDGKCDVLDLGGDKCEGAKCAGLDSGEFTINIPQDSKSFTINTHDGKTAGDAMNVRDVCGGPQGGQGGSCATGPYTAHCLINFDVYNDCGYFYVGGDEEPASDPESEENPFDEEEPEESPVEEPAEEPAEEPVEEPAEEPASDPEEETDGKSGGGFAQNTCDAGQWVPFDNSDSPTGMVRCCAGKHGNKGEEYAKCDTSSCVNNFNAKNRNCFNYGAPQNGKNAKDNAGSEQCPYADSDHAICDTSFYDDINPVACRTNPAGKNYQVHCLGKVKCNTVGVTIPKNGHSDGTADYDETGEKECLGAMEGFAAGDDCFYDGSSENWKVCDGAGEPAEEEPEEEPVEEPEPVEETTAKQPEPPAPSPSKGSGSGDPHFKTWTGDKYDYHGECDLVLVDNPTFGNGKGLRVHIRTSRVKYFSFIEKVAVQIGEDVLEFDNDVANFLINGAKVESNHKHHKTKIGGYIVRRDKKAISIRLHEEGRAATVANHGTVAKIDLHTRKNGFPAVIVDGGNTDTFKGSLGLLGDWATGKRLARDGKTEMNDHDATAFALEWQVRDTEPMLFTEARFPQFPTTCTPPAKKVAGRLGISNFEMEAEKACAHWKEDKEDCIFDVIATRDVLVAEEGHVVHLS